MAANFKIRPYFVFGLLAVLALLVFSGSLLHLLTESWWFEAVGYSDVFRIRVTWQLVTALGAFVLSALVLWGNYRLALWQTRDRDYYRPANSEWAPYIPALTRYAALILILLLSLSWALGAAAAWETILKFLNPSEFGVSEPIYGQDIGFYVFRLPFYQGLQQAASELIVWSIILAIAIYAIRGEVRPERGWKYFLTGEVKAHLCVLLALLAVAIAAGFWLARYDLLYSPTGVVFGAGYTDVNARMHAYGIMGVITLVVGGLFVASLWRSGFSLPVAGIAVYAVIFLLVNGLYPWAQQKFVVEPNELDKERPFIQHNIELTRQAYSLTQIQQEPFAVEGQLDRPAIDQNAATVENIRLWDYATLLSTYQELQSLRLYYRFHDVDIDRYTLNGDYRQVMLAPRELDYNAVPDQAQTWVNQRLKYTHGYGLAMSPVNQVTVEGLPEFFIQDIPPASTVDLSVDQPRLYYGEETDHYIFTGTTTQEFDYPQGDQNALNNYDGEGGVPMGSFWRRLAYAADQGSLKILISNYFTPQSRIHYYRNVRQRVQQIAPFLSLDSDPYLSLIDGRMKWIVDGYTISDRYPYSEPISSTPDAAELLQNREIERIARSDTNYIRDAVKVVVDAYDGTLQFYVVDAADPILATYQKIFPSLFQPAEVASADLRAHYRYPLNLFQIQAQLYRAYHMEDPDVFYNQEDLWQFPLQVGEDDQLQRMEPYYVIMRLPNADGEEFLQILPFTPSTKDNMVAWMAARCDGENYGSLVLYEFPKQELVYGPKQIEARIDQNPEISQQLTLWNQQGSSVIRGDLLVIPVEQSLLYFEPVYLKADQGALPELKRVIVAYENTIVMRQALPEALQAIFSGASESAPVESAAAESSGDSTAGSATPSRPITPEQAETVAAALEAYQQGQTALQAGDWTAYGQAQKQLGQLLEQLQAAQTSPRSQSPTQSP
ncbi:UPF0182 family membrane protein [Vasconcelosia minhoensis]|uniref:UPF0182 family membrane protein n=1 Tax=Vasconcelosia minhoensis TaxID=3366354 RepID=UPI002AD39D12|nr:UPF0182 family protein [Romeria gracilis]